MPIRVLPEDVASQIAAGEVVERPSSVVKELVENSIDAGSRDIQVETHAGGKRLIRVADDGCGISASEVEVAFCRHSTSKLSTADDLNRITTLGFRGEALASIAAVSHVTLATRAAQESVGALLRLEGGRVVSRRESGRPPGTAVTVEELFFNVPARLKFLRADRTERRHIDAWLTRYAMAYPGVRFTLSHDGRVVFQSPGNDLLRDVIVAVHGLEIGAALLKIEAKTDAEITSGDQHPGSHIQVAGFVSPPSVHRANRSYITLFINGRWVYDTSLTYAVVQAYHTLLPTGRYPLAVVMVQMPPADVDVNVHPTKSEVRFSDGDAVFRAVQRAVRRTVIQRSPAPSIHSLTSTWGSSATPWREETRERGRERLAALGHQPSGEQLHFEPRPSGITSPARDILTPSEERIPPLRVVGQLGTTYIVAEGPAGMYLIDQHAAHERVLFERMLAEREQAQIVSQVLLEPRPVDVTPETAGVVEEHLETLSSLGFQIEPFGGMTMLVRALPALVADTEPNQILEDVAAALQAGDTPLAGRVEEIVARQVCKRAAIKAGQVMTHPEMEELVRTLEQCASPRTCPHGRPTMIHLSVAQLAREFGR
jgi:DNA mismatch repair protein MutL